VIIEANLCSYLTIEHYLCSVCTTIVFIPFTYLVTYFITYFLATCCDTLRSNHCKGRTLKIVLLFFTRRTFSFPYQIKTKFISLTYRYKFRRAIFGQFMNCPYARLIVLVHCFREYLAKGYSVKLLV
jgi:hypothetical protein